MDFVHDQLATGHKLRVLTIVDIFSRFSPALVPRFTFRGSDVVAMLERACKEVGYPATIRVDQGSAVAMPNASDTRFAVLSSLVAKLTRM